MKRARSERTTWWNGLIVDPQRLKGGWSLDLKKPGYMAEDPEHLLKSIKVQYMEALYKSRASLAYFAKGPLSRARAAFADDDAKAGLISLVDYLRTLIIPLSLLDKKYRETLPALISEMPNSNISEGERTEVATRFQKTIPQSKKSRIGKNGLYPEEELDVQHWWIDQLASSPARDSADLRAVAVKTTILEQRAREIYLQIILILEVLALEAVLSLSTPEKAVAQADKNQDPQKKRKAKKPQDLDTLLDLSIDKLCIWQSMAVDENISLEHSGETDARSDGSLPTKKRDGDHLRDFCVDVILPL